MPLINLKLIGKLKFRACQTYRAMEATCFNSSPFLQIDPSDAYQCLKTYKQAQALHESLELIHALCTDYSASVAQSRKEWEKYEDDPFDPLLNVKRIFISGGADALPPRIEQYAELVYLASRYEALETETNDLFNQAFGHLPRYGRSVDKDGSNALIPLSELPQQMQLEREVAAEISAINVTYCLDGYNEFYKKALKSIAAHRKAGTVEVCAAEILSFFNYFLWTIHAKNSSVLVLLLPSTSRESGLIPSSSGGTDSIRPGC